MQLFLGIHGKQEGPYSLAEVEENARQGGIPDDALVWHEGLTEWTNLKIFLGQRQESTPAIRPAPVSPPESSPEPAARTSGLALTSLVLGVLGFCGITALFGLLFGILAMVKIRRSQGRLKGNGMAVAGICVSAVMLLVSLPLLSALILPAMTAARRSARSAQCMNNIKTLNLALRQYANEYNDLLPPAESWCDAISAYATPETFLCPTHSGEGRCSYALNRNLAGQSYDRLSPVTVLIFETDPGWNVAGTEERITHPHGRLSVIGFVDGHVERVYQDQEGTLDWGFSPLAPGQPAP